MKTASEWIVAYPDRTRFRGYFRMGGDSPRIVRSGFLILGFVN